MNDWELLTNNLNQKLTFIHGKEFESLQNVAITFYKEIELTKDYNVFHIKSESYTHQISYSTFYDCFLQYSIEHKVEFKEVGKKLLKDITQSETVGYLLDMNNALNRNAIGERYRDILIFIEELTQDIPPIFLFFNFSEYDLESRNLIQWMVMGKLNRFYPFLEKAKYVFLCDENENFDLYCDICALKHVDLTLQEPMKKHVPEIWNRYVEGRKLSSEDIQQIHSFSGGKLSNVELIISFLSQQTEIEWTNDNFTLFITNIFNMRLSDLKNWKNDVKELLELAARIGEIFDLRWINYSLGKISQGRYESLLKKCSQEQFITYSEKRGKFTNKLIWEFFNNSSHLRKKELARMLSQTVDYFSPHDYFSRAFYTEESGDEKTAHELYVFEYWRRIKENLPVSDEFTKKLYKLCKKYNTSAYLRLIKTYYEKQADGQYYEMLSDLENADAMYEQPLRLLLLKDFLLSCIYHKVSADREMNNRALLLMEQVEAECEKIGEMAFRCNCLSTLISFYANMGETNKALGTSKKLIYYYSQRKDFDNNALIGIQILNRKSSAFMSTEIAVKKTGESKNYFKNTMLYAQYVMALNNHGANLFVLGKFDRALNCMQEAISFIGKHPTVKVNPVYIWNNFYLATFYAEKANRIYALEQLEKLVAKLEDTELKIIPLINLSIFYMIERQDLGIELALKYLEDAANLNIELQDDYYEYYINANKAAVLYLQNECSNAILYMKKCQFPPALMKASERIYLKKRTQQWLQVMEQNTNVTFEEFDTYLLANEQDNTAWIFMGRGFLPSDIQFWSES